MTNSTHTPMDPFVHLHSHSTYSLLDGFSTIPELVSEAVRLGQPAIAVTDHGNMHAAYEFYKECMKQGIKPIIGIEAYVAPSIGTHTDHKPLYFNGGVPGDTSGKGSYTHMLLFAKNNVGLKNLFKLCELSYTEGFYRKNRMSVELFEKYHEGIIATTGCPSGELQTLLRLGMQEEALAYATRMQDIFGKNNYYLELMDHEMSIGLEREVQEGLLYIAQALNIPLLATNDNHFTKKSEANAHEHMLCIATRSTMNVPTSRDEGDGGKTRFAFDGDGYYVKSYEEMERLFPEDRFPGALSNTLKLAEQCNVTIEPDPTLRPKLDLPDGHTEETYIRSEVKDGLDKLENLGRLHGTRQEYEDRINTELDVIIPKDYSNYFLVVSDFVRWAKFIAEPRVPVGPGRGSAGGSLVAFLLNITDVDPIRHGLLFERFLNPERDSPPDIDMDFNDVDRIRVIEYVKQKYGLDHVSYVVTFGKILAKNAIKDTIRILDEPFALGNDLTKAMPEPVFGKTMSLSDMYNSSSARYSEAGDFRDLVVERDAQHIVGIAKQLEGRVRSTGVHAAAVIISSQPVSNTVPMMRRDADGAMITQWDYPTCEEIGLLKVDFLGLRNLGIIRDAVVHIKNNHGVDINLDELIHGPMDDPKTYQLLQNGNTSGVFQIEGAGMQSLLKLMKPDRFEDISAVLSLYRPGPMGVDAHTDYALRKVGKQEVSYAHPDLEEVLKPILGPTFGVVVYQEQVQLIARNMAGFTLGEADNLRRAMGKKKKEILEKEYGPFLAGAMKNGHSEEAVKAIWDVLVPFADYAFNKSHTVAYGVVSYMTAYLKANYPTEYMAALLTSVSDDTDKTAIYLDDARRNHITVLPPDVSESGIDYLPLTDGTIRFGLKAIRGVGEAAAGDIVKSRENQKYVSFTDFITKLPPTLVNKRILEGLAYGGALDSWGISRRAYIHQIPEAIKVSKGVNKSKASTQMSLFDVEDVVDFTIQPMNEYPRMEKLKLERQALGLYISDHPINGLNISNMATVTIGALRAKQAPVLADGAWPERGATPQRIAGIMTALAVRRTKKGDQFAIVTLEDRSGSIEAAIFPKVFKEVADLLALDGVFQFLGFARERDGEVSFTVDNVRPLEFNDSGNLSIRLKLTQKQFADGKEELERRLIRHHPIVGEAGDAVIISLKADDGEITEIQLETTARRSSALVSEIQELFGALCIGRWRKPKPPKLEEEKE